MTITCHVIFEINLISNLCGICMSFVSIVCTMTEIMTKDDKSAFSSLLVLSTVFCDRGSIDCMQNSNLGYIKCTFRVQNKG